MVSTMETCLFGLVMVISFVASGADKINFNNPVRSAAEDLVDNADIGLKTDPGFKQYSGYLNADNKSNVFFHYWFVESANSPSKDPLILWLNGGPGCSSMLGLLEELGPFEVNQDGKSLRMRKYFWNKNANVLFLESPMTVGYSYAVDGSNEADDDSTAMMNYHALRSFLDKFPELKGRSLFLSGESYGGVYLPTLSVLVDDDPELNFKGVAIGNGFLHAQKLAESLVFYGYFHNLYGTEVWQGLSEHCCADKEPSRDVCDFITDNITPKCQMFVHNATDDVLSSGLNPYSIYAWCGAPDPSSLVDRRPRRITHQLGLTLSPFKSFRGRSGKILHQPLKDDPPCADDGPSASFLNSPATRKALHIPEALKDPFIECSDKLHYTMVYPFTPLGLEPQIRKLLESPRHLQILIYNGDADMMCNYLGDQWFVDDLKLKMISDFKPWRVDGQTAGYVKRFEQLSFLTLKGVGHMVPQDSPKWALHMIETFVKKANHDY